MVWPGLGTPPHWALVPSLGKAQKTPDAEEAGQSRVCMFSVATPTPVARDDRGWGTGRRRPAGPA